MLDKCLSRAYSKVDDQVYARAVCLGSGEAMAEGVQYFERVSGAAVRRR
jgi:hypothetical protein